jgi:hypothetical protein
MAKRKSPPKEKPAEMGYNIQQTITQSVVAWDDVAFSKLLDMQQTALGELTSIKTLLDLSKEVKKAETTSTVAAQPDYSKIQEEMLKVAKEQFKGSRRYWKTQDEFQVEWDKEAKNIAEMAKGMKTFKTLGEKLGDKKEGFKEKYGSAGGLKKTVLGALNVGGIFNKTLERDKFVEQQRALGSTASTKDLKKDYAGAQAASKATKKTEAQIDKIKTAAANGGPEISEEQLKSSNPEFAKLLEKRQSNADEFGKYQRATDIYSPTPVNRNLVPTAGAAKMTPAQAAKVAEKKATSGMNNLVPTPTTPELGKTPTSTAAEATQGAEIAEEGKKMTEEELKLLKTIAENTGGTKKSGDKKAEPAKAEGGGFLDTIMSFLGDGLMLAFKKIFNPMNILKTLGKVFAIGMIIGALFEGVMDGFDEFMKTGDIGKALIAGLAGIIDFLTFGLFDKEKIKEVIGDFSKWTYDHLVKPFVDFITTVKDSFMKLIENIGVPEIKFKIPIIGKEVSIGPFYPFKSDAKATPAAPTAAAPTTANQVESQSAENSAAQNKPAASNNTSLVNAPITTNNNTTQVQLRPPIRNEESSNSRYAASRYA